MNNDRTEISRHYEMDDRHFSFVRNSGLPRGSLGERDTFSADGCVFWGVVCCVIFALGALWITV